MTRYLKFSGVLFLFLSLLFHSCKKQAGPGGNSAIRGTVSGLHADNGKDPSKEITTIIFTEGAMIDDNDYWLLNAASGNQYYIWYDNTNWVGGDPALSGRTGIKVTYDFYASNTDIANSSLVELTTYAGADFTFSINNDIITITDKNTGVVTDADDMITPFSVDVASQGSSGTSGGSGTTGPMADQRVYLIYNNDDFYSEDVRTDGAGKYEFRGLHKGRYRIYAFTKETSGFLSKVEVEAEITENKSIVEAPEIYIVD